MPPSLLVTPTSTGVSQHNKNVSQQMKTPTKVQNFMSTYSAMGASTNHPQQVPNKDLALLDTSLSGINNQDSGTIPGMKILRGPFNVNCATSRDP